LPRRSIHSATSVMAASSSGRLRRGNTGSSVCRPVRAATHGPDIGHVRHAGEVGVHTVAPSSIRPWFSSPGARSSGNAAISASASAQTRR
jgi:hypothetical protein